MGGHLMRRGSRKRAFARLGAVCGAVLGLFPAVATAQVQLPTIDVVGTSPLSTDDIERQKVPANVEVIPAEDLDHVKSDSVADALFQNIPSVWITDTAVNPFQPDVQYRGFVASPTVGTPQGLAVYQNGVRVNEVFGDTVNWDFIPSYAVHRLDVVPNDPAYGLNALGGAISIPMKNGFH